MAGLGDLEKTCFVIMPFGLKPVGDRKVDFDGIFRDVFAPAIEAAKTVEGEALNPARTDQDAFSSSINQDMFDYIVYSRLAIADVSGSNPNALYELGARHALQDAGTVILRQKGQVIPYDIRTIKVFEYEFEGDGAIARSKEFLSNLLSETLKRNRLDSPIRQALRQQYAQRARPEPAEVEAAGGEPVAVSGDLDDLLRDAEYAALRKEWTVAGATYRALLRLDPAHLVARMKLGMLLKDRGEMLAAHEEFATLVRLYPEYGEAWREKGVMESLLLRKFGKKEDVAASLPHAGRSFERATELCPEDADAWAAWGGLLRRFGDEKEALAKYKVGAEVSNGHPYPLLNAAKIEAKLSGTGKVDIDQGLLANARAFREVQANHEPPRDTPWCFFDLAVLNLLEGDGPGFLERVRDGLATIDLSEDIWQVTSLRDDLQATLVDGGIEMDGLAEGMEVLGEVIAGVG